MPAVETALRATAPPPVAAPLLKKCIAEEAPVTRKSVALFRFGEQCNNNCPMCSNTGSSAVFFRPTDELLRRAAFLRAAGFRRAVVTGGEATIHPGFWQVTERLADSGMIWDINTHGRSFARPGFARRAMDTGLKRAIVSLHSHHAPTSAAIFGVNEAAHYETVAGIEKLVAAGALVMINCVFTRLNLAHLEEYLLDGAARFGRTVGFKFVFPSTIGVGGGWSGIDTLRYDDVRQTVRRLRALAAARALRVFFESFPSCVLGDAEAKNVGRSGFGETHYLDDASGDRVYAMRHIEAELSAYGDACRTCSAVRRCAGVSLRYAQRWGVEELTPFV